MLNPAIGSNSLGKGMRGASQAIIRGKELPGGENFDFFLSKREGALEK